MKKNRYFYTNLLAWGLVLFLIGNYVFAWTTPSGNPPTSNLPAPINTSPTNQSKEGYLAVGMSTAPSYPLDVAGTGRFTGTVTAPTFSGALSGNATSATTASDVSCTNCLTNVEVASADVASDLSCTDCIGTTEIADSYVLNTSDSMSGDLTVGSTGRSANTFVRALAGDAYITGFEAYGSSQGTGYLYIGQSSTYGGGIFYNGDGSPAFATGEGADKISFYRNTAGAKEVVFSYPHNSNTVTFRGTASATGFFYSSDESLKENVQKIETPLAKIMKLDGISFDWKESGKKSIGLIAQDVEKIFPEIVNIEKETGLKSIEYAKLVAPLIEATKEQQKMIDKQRKLINQQGEEIKTLKALFEQS